jgi:hypothetical protein
MADIHQADAVRTTDERPYMDWPAVFGGAVLASAISVVLLTFGSALGLSLTSAREGQSASLFAITIVSGLWILTVQLSAALAGGYLAGRMRRRHSDATEYESDIRDGSHGLVTWAVATLIAAAITISSLAGTAATVGQVAGAAASTVGPTAQALASNDLLVDRVVRAAPGAEPTDDATRQQVGRILVSAVTSPEGITQADREYIVALTAERAGIPPEEADQRIEETLAAAQQLENEARALAEQARRTAMISAFLLAVSLALGAAVAYYAATLGGNHRDRQIVVPGWYKPW